MKKLFSLLLLFASVSGLQASAQDAAQSQRPQGDPAAMMQRMKERVKPQLVEKTGITSEQADKVIEAQFKWQRSTREARMDQNLSAEEKTKRNSEADALRDKDFVAIPLTVDQQKSVKDFFEEMRKQMGDRRKQQGQ